MSADRPVTLETLNAADKQEFVAALGDIYERSPWVAEAAFAARPFPSLVALNEHMRDTVECADDARKLALLKTHPDLAGKAARAGVLTADSKAEQSSAGLDRLSDAEFESFQQLNERYRRKFDFPFIICVRRHSKDSLFKQFAARLKNDAARERESALAEIYRIAALRLDQHVTAPDRLKVAGQLSTHVLDTYHGRPAAGVALELMELLRTGENRLLFSGATNADGRTDGPLIGDRPIPIGRYELRFAVGDYFAQNGLLLPDPSFLDVVPVQFSVAEPEAHYHVPLLATPWSYSTYRGS